MILAWPGLAGLPPECYPDPMEVPSAEARAQSSPLGQYQILLEVSEAIARHRDLGELFHDLADRLHRVLQFDYLSLLLTTRFAT